MREYESIVVLSPNLAETELQGACQKVDGLLEKLGAQGVAVDDWGRRQIAYTVAKKDHGFYRRYEYKTDNSDLVAKLNAELNLMESVIKFQTHRLSNKTRKFKGNPKAYENGDGSDEDTYE